MRQHEQRRHRKDRDGRPGSGEGRAPPDLRPAPVRVLPRAEPRRRPRLPAARDGARRRGRPHARRPAAGLLPRERHPGHHGRQRHAARRAERHGQLLQLRHRLAGPQRPVGRELRPAALARREDPAGLLRVHARAVPEARHRAAHMNGPTTDVNAPDRD